MLALSVAPIVNSVDDYSKKVSLDFLIKNSDIISIHVNYSEKTHKLINSSLLSRFEQCPIIINTSRGEVVDEYSIVEALKEGTISGYATDVLYDETSLDKDWLSENKIWNQIGKQKVLISPHIGGATHESIHDSEVHLSKKLKDYLSVYE